MRAVGARARDAPIRNATTAEQRALQQVREKFQAMAVPRGLIPHQK
jgi:hypothetical protein